MTTLLDRTPLLIETLAPGTPAAGSMWRPEKRLSPAAHLRPPTTPKPAPIRKPAPTTPKPAPRPQEYIVHHPNTGEHRFTATSPADLRSQIRQNERQIHGHGGEAKDISIRTPDTPRWKQGSQGGYDSTIGGAYSR